MGKRNPQSPWNPAIPPDLSPKEYEKQVVTWLRRSGTDLQMFTVNPLRMLGGPGGDYEFDAVAEFSILRGARFVVLVECKRYSQPVEREKVQVLWAKLQDVKAHKAMMFATCGFQSGAIEYASAYGIATVTFVRGDFLYETLSAFPTAAPPSYVDLPAYAGILLAWRNEGITCSTIDSSNIGPLSDWLTDGTKHSDQWRAD